MNRNERWIEVWSDNNRKNALSIPTVIIQSADAGVNKPYKHRNEHSKVFIGKPHT